MVALDLPDLAQETFEFPLNIITTTNNSNREESADIVEIGVPFSERRIVIDGVEFGLRLMFGNTTEEGFSEVDRFFVFEDGTAVPSSNTKKRSTSLNPSSVVLPNIRRSPNSTPSITIRRSENGTPISTISALSSRFELFVVVMMFSGNSNVS